MKFVAATALGAAMIFATTGGVFPAWGQTETPVPTEHDPPVTMTAIQPDHPASSRPGGPVIQSITANVSASGLMSANMIVPQIHFIDASGNAVLLHREVMETNANQMDYNASSVINIPSQAQKRGAVLSGDWNCGTSTYYVRLNAYIMDADGNRSNTIQYTIHCNGG
jgi:hypothetical protein